jgi:hypothetical protein
MRITLTVIKADIGSIYGVQKRGVRPHRHETVIGALLARR